MTPRVAHRMQDISPFYVMELLKRARELESQGRDIVHMEIGEPDFLTPDAVTKAAAEFIQSGQVKYTPAAGLPELREKIAGFYQQQYSVSIDKERVFITPGASGALLLALGATLNPGEEMLLSDPCYPCNSNFIRLYSGHPRLIPVNADTDYQLNAKLIKMNWRTETRAALIASPSNPTGTVITKANLEESMNTVHRLGGWFFSDEIYHGLVYGKPAVSALELSDQAFVINSFSKYFGMTGWRIGWMIVPEAFCSPIEKLAQNVFISTPSVSQYAALSAFSEENLMELERRRLEFKNRRDYLYQQLLGLGFDIAVKPEGAFYIYANCSQFTRDSFQFAKELLEAEGVAITPGKDFGCNKPEQYIRFSYTTSIAQLEKGIEGLRRFINRE